MRHQTARVENAEVSDMDSQSSKGQRTKKIIQKKYSCTVLNVNVKC